MGAILPLTIIVHTKNSALTLKQCLGSLPAVNELLVVDMASTDDTVRIAKEFQARVIAVADAGYVEPARSIALAAATQPWILIVDADESLPMAVADWLPALLEQNEYTIFALPRRNVIFGRPLEHTGWWPDYQVRLFQKGAVTWTDVIHAQPDCTSQPHQLPADDDHAILHQNYQQVSQFLDRMNRYTTIEARCAAQTASGAWLTQQSGEFFSRLVSRQGWQDKEQGLAVSLLQSFYPLVTALKRWEDDGFPPATDFEACLASQLAVLQRDVAFWRATYQISHSVGLLQFYWRIRRKLQM